MKIKYYIPTPLQGIYRLLLSIGFLIATITSCIPVSNAASYDNVSSTLSDSNDTYIVSTDGAYTGKGTETAMGFGYSISPNYTSISYIDFMNAANYAGNYHNATLWFYVPSNPNPAQTFYIYNVNQSWDENTLWWGNTPTNDTIRYTYSFSDTTYGWKSFNITNIANNWTYGIVIVPENTTGEGTNISSIYTKEYGSLYPYIIAYTNPVLLYPTNNLQINTSYPPLSTSINFTWASSPSNSYNLQIATDSLFYMTTVDTTISSNYSIQSLPTGVYYWRVRYYDIATSSYSPWSMDYLFTISNTVTISGTGINGVIYELLSGEQVPISDVTVIISNTTYTTSQITGSNGYYQFIGLSNGVYILHAIRQDIYTDSISYYVTVSNNTIYTQDIQLQRCVSGFTCFYNQQYVQFIVTDYWVTARYSGVTATVYTDSSVVPILSGTTGTDGSVSFLLIKNQQYTLVFSNSSLGIDTTVTIIPVNILYYIRTSIEVYDWHSGTGGYDLNKEVSTSINALVINATSAYINVSYNDSLSQTSNLIFYLNSSSSNDPLNHTTLQTHNGGSASTHSHSFIVTNFSCTNYHITITATHTTFKNIIRDYGVTFPGMCSPSGLNSTLIYYFGVALLIFIGAMAGATSSTQISGVVVFIGWVLQGWGWIAGVNTIDGLTAGLTLATIFVAISMMNDRARNEGVA